MRGDGFIIASSLSPSSFNSRPCVRGDKQYTGATRVFDERLYKKHLKRGYPEKTDAEIDALACAWFPECKGGKTDIPFLTYTDALNKMRDLVGEVKRREV